MYRRKRQWFNGVKDLTVVTPSEWLAGLVKESFLRAYPVKVINNGIDLSVFCPTEGDFKERYQCKDKTVLLGVAYDWSVKKGLDVFVELAKRLNDSYRIVLIGTDDEVDAQLPQNVISIHRTYDRQEMAEIYSSADIFINPTREDTYPTVNMESIACGTPVITFPTGGSPEIVDEGCGVVLKSERIEELLEAISTVKHEKNQMHEHCLAAASRFSSSRFLAEYLSLYGEQK